MRALGLLATCFLAPNERASVALPCKQVAKVDASSQTCCDGKAVHASLPERGGRLLPQASQLDDTCSRNDRATAQTTKSILTTASCCVELRRTSAQPESRSRVEYTTADELVRDVQDLRWLGQGAQGVVYEGMWQGATVAVKFGIVEAVDTWAYELLFSKLLSHPNVVQTFQAKVAVLDEKTIHPPPQDLASCSGPLLPNGLPSMQIQQPTRTSPSSASSATAAAAAASALYRPTREAAAADGPTAAGAAAAAATQGGGATQQNARAGPKGNAHGVSGPGGGGGGGGGLDSGLLSSTVLVGRTDSLHSDDGFGNPFGRRSTFTDVREVLAGLGAKPGHFITQMVMEHCDHGSLHSAIQRGIFAPNSRWGPKLALRALIRTAREVAQGMYHLHANNVLHGDLKPANVLLMNSRKDRRGYVAKVSDFGLAQYCNQDHISNAPWGTLVYMAPERLLRGQLFPASDVYSFGVILWEMCHGQRPYEGMHVGQIVMACAEGGTSLEWSAEACDEVVSISRACMASSPHDRPSFATLMKDLALLEARVRQAGLRSDSRSSLEAGGPGGFVRISRTSVDASTLRRAVTTGAVPQRASIDSAVSQYHAAAAAATATRRGSQELHGAAAAAASITAHGGGGGGSFRRSVGRLSSDACCPPAASSSHNHHNHHNHHRAPTRRSSRLSATSNSCSGTSMATVSVHMPAPPVGQGAPPTGRASFSLTPLASSPSPPLPAASAGAAGTGPEGSDRNAAGGRTLSGACEVAAATGCGVTWQRAALIARDCRTAAELARVLVNDGDSINASEAESWVTGAATAVATEPLALTTTVAMAAPGFITLNGSKDSQSPAGMGPWPQLSSQTRAVTVIEPLIRLPQLSHQPPQRLLQPPQKNEQFLDASFPPVVPLAPPPPSLESWHSVLSSKVPVKLVETSQGQRSGKEPTGLSVTVINGAQPPYDGRVSGAGSHGNPSPVAVAIAAGASMAAVADGPPLRGGFEGGGKDEERIGALSTTQKAHCVREDCDVDAFVATAAVAANPAAAAPGEVLVTPTPTPAAKTQRPFDRKSLEYGLVQQHDRQPLPPSSPTSPHCQVPGKRSSGGGGGNASTCIENAIQTPDQAGPFTPAEESSPCSVDPWLGTPPLEHCARAASSTCPVTASCSSGPSNVGCEMAFWTGGAQMSGGAGGGAAGLWEGGWVSGSPDASLQVFTSTGTPWQKVVGGVVGGGSGGGGGSGSGGGGGSCRRRSFSLSSSLRHCGSKTCEFETITEEPN